MDVHAVTNHFDSVSAIFIDLTLFHFECKWFEREFSYGLRIFSI